MTSVVCVRIRVFTGATMGNQSQVFFPAMAAIQSKLITAFQQHKVELILNIESMKAEEIRELQWTPSQFIDWLLESDIHFILAHMHQGLDKLKWNMEELLQQYERLSDHVGYPVAKCHIFLQDKFNYLRLLQPNDILPMISIDIPKLLPGVNISLTDHVIHTLLQFDALEKLEGCLGYVLKTPFTTHGSPFRDEAGGIYCSDINAVMVRLAKIIEMSNSRDDVHQIPYVMLMPRLVRNRERKCVVLNGEAKIISETIGTGAFSVSRDDCLVFAEKIVADLKAACPETMSEFIIRVDIFEVNNGRLVVNELESFDANYYSTNGQRFRFVRSMLADGSGAVYSSWWSNDNSATFFNEFWENKIESLVLFFLDLLSRSS